MKLHDLKPAPGSRKDPIRKGRGTASGRGKTAGRGQDGQKSRSGGGVRIGFEGGQMPLTRRVPKRGFNNKRFKDPIASFNVERLNVFKKGSVVTLEELRAKGIIKNKDTKVKILGEGDLNVALTLKAGKLSKTAYDKVIAAGGKVEEIQND